MKNVAIIGAGFMGETHATNYMQIKNARLVAVCETNAEKGAKFASKFGIQAYRDFQDMIDNENVDVIDICLPTFLHPQVAIAAANAGKHVICEKPVALTVEALDQMLDAVRKNGVHLYVCQVVRFWPEYVKAKELLENGTLGEFKSYYAARLSQHPAWSEWYRRPENSGGGILDLHLHDVDYATYLFGAPKKVYAIGKKNGVGCWNYVSSILRFNKGYQCTIEGILEMPLGWPFTTDLRIVGSKRAYEASMKAGRNVENIASSHRSAYLYGDDREEEVKLERYDAYLCELQHFIDCIEDGRASEVVSEDQIRISLCTIRALKKSLEDSQEVEVDYR